MTGNAWMPSNGSNAPSPSVAPWPVTIAAIRRATFVVASSLVSRRPLSAATSAPTNAAAAVSRLVARAAAVSAALKTAARRRVRDRPR